MSGKIHGLVAAGPMLIFVAKREAVEMLTKRQVLVLVPSCLFSRICVCVCSLIGMGIKAMGIHGDKNQYERMDIMAAFKKVCGCCVVGPS